MLGVNDHGQPSEGLHSPDITRNPSGHWQRQTGPAAGDAGFFCIVKIMSASLHSASRLHPPWIKAVVVVLPADFPVSELEPDRQVGAHFRVGGKGVDGNRQVPAPENLERD